VSTETDRLDERTNAIQQRIGRLETAVGGVEDQLTEIAIEIGVQSRLRERAGDDDEAPTTAADGGSRDV
jgi:archaellum component FlaC